MVSNYDSLAVFSIADPAAPTAKSLLELRHAYSLSGGDTLGMLADGHLGLLPVTDRWLGPTHSVTRGEAKDAAIDHSGNVYVADGDSGLTILATGNTSTQTGHLNLPGNSCAVAKSGSRCFVGTTEGGLYVIDVINRAVPRLLDSVKLPGPIADIAAVDSLVAVASGPGGLHILNVGRQSEVTVLLSLTDTGPVYHAVATHTQVFYIEQGAGINAINIDDPAHPGAARQIVKGEGQFFVNDGDMDLYHNYILAASRNRAYLIDTNNPSSGVLSQYIGTSSCRSLAVRDGRKTLTILSEGWVHHYTIR